MLFDYSTVYIIFVAFIAFASRRSFEYPQVSSRIRLLPRLAFLDPCVHLSVHIRRSVGKLPSVRGEKTERSTSLANSFIRGRSAPVRHNPSICRHGVSRVMPLLAACNRVGEKESETRARGRRVTNYYTCTAVRKVTRSGGRSQFHSPPPPWDTPGALQDLPASVSPLAPSVFVWCPSPFSSLCAGVPMQVY